MGRLFLRRGKSSGPRGARAKRRRPAQHSLGSSYARRLRVEQLEGRSMLAAVFWDGGGDGVYWTHSGNWSNNQRPGPDDDVTINVPGLTVVMAVNTQSIKSLTIGANVTLTQSAQGIPALVVSGPATIAGTLTVAAGDGMTFNGPTSISTLNMVNASLSGTGDVTVTHAMVWTGGTINGTGKLTIAPDASLSLTTGSHALNRTLENNGTASWTSGDLLLTADWFNNGAFISNSDSALSAKSGSSDTFTFHHVGSLIKQGKGVTTIGTGLQLDDQGSISLEAGTFALSGGATINESVSVLAGATLALGNVVSYSPDAIVTGDGNVDFTGGTHEIPADRYLVEGLITFSGGTITVNTTFDPTTVRFGNATVNVNTPLLFTSTTVLNGSVRFNEPTVFSAPLTINSEVIFNAPATIKDVTMSAPLGFTGFTSNATVTINGNFDWRSGTILGTARTVLAPSSALRILSTDDHGIGFGGILQNDGAAVWSAGRLFMNNGTLVNNGAFTASSDSALLADNFSILLGGPSSNSFSNTGVFIKAGAGVAQIGSSKTGIDFRNSGVIDVENGTISFSRPLVISGQGVINGSIDGTLAVQSDLLGDSTNGTSTGVPGAILFNGASTSAHPQQFEASSQNLGDNVAAAALNFAIQKLSLDSTRWVKLVDLSDNSPGVEPEAVYVDTLIVPADATLDLNGIHLYARSQQVVGTILNGQVTQLLPATAQLLVSGGEWAPQVFDKLQATSLGVGGYAIPGNSLDPSIPLPWVNLDEIKFAFNQDVIVQAASLTITSSRFGSVIPVGFMYDSVTHVATWKLGNPIGNDKLNLSLVTNGPSAVTDANRVPLDGDDDGEPGGDFAFQFSVLPGDFTRDGVVDIQDITNVANRWLKNNPMSDATGRGVVDIVDLVLIANHWLSTNHGDIGGNSSVAAASEAALAPLEQPHLLILPTPTIEVSDESCPNNAVQVQPTPMAVSDLLVDSVMNSVEDTSATVHQQSEIVLLDCSPVQVAPAALMSAAVEQSSHAQLSMQASRRPINWQVASFILSQTHSGMAEPSSLRTLFDVARWQGIDRPRATRPVGSKQR